MISVFHITDHNQETEEVEDWLIALDHLRGAIIRGLKAEGKEITQDTSSEVFREIERTWEDERHLKGLNDSMTVYMCTLQRVPANLYNGRIRYTEGNEGELAPFAATSLNAAKARIESAVNVDEVLDIKPLAVP